MDNKPCGCECHKQGHHHHHHNISKKHFHIRKTFLSRIYFTLFYISMALLFLIIVINSIFSFFGVYLPRIFFPGIIVYLGTFIVAGGILGSFGPVDKSEPQLMQMRKCSSFIMLIICFIFTPIFLSRNINLYSSIKSSQTFCEQNKGKSRGDKYYELSREKEKIFQKKNIFENKYKNGLTCFENQKCLKSISNPNLYICNYNYEEKYNTANCNKVFENDELVNTFDNANIAHFAGSCMDLKKEKLRENIDLYRCISGRNIRQDDSNSKEDQLLLEQYYNKTNEKFNQKLAEIEQKMDEFDDEIYFYDERCRKNYEYTIYFVAIIAHIIVHMIVFIIWLGIGISNTLKFFGLKEDTEMIYYQDKIKQMNNIYQNINNPKNEENQCDESTPINIK